MAWGLLGVAVVTEVVATLSLRGMAGGGKGWLVAVVVVGYVVSFSVMALALRSLNVGVAYAIWSGVGTAGVSLAAVWLFGERLNAVAVGGMALIVAGVVVLVSSGATSHG
ncbi:DMT family transporter [Phytomonospora endophytica]|uniref:Small multidrug resistance pump n=1 Tax=Phytomonospora endophytica TaxID=714109 RepID=A0A841FKV3_9ACTN|nr:SMR family transporter [Phytomonospora endophytica]MBB6033817.1 small multidrug resistance pump [Phytomonospora endophytica]GIG64665.1 multidrug SMR transporter [Phytomonospora endophytica]